MTCGVLVTDGTHLLICHPTNGRVWDIPKGKKEQGEEMDEAASREMLEETGLMVSPDRLDLMGIYAYKPEKDLVLFRHVVGGMPDPSTLFCTSEFDDQGTMTKEMDGYAVLPVAEAIGMLNRELAAIVSRIFHV